ncbi:nuclear pore complex protein Nup98-Nup96 [Musca vetustissima]|uniref:nuclear pore complex protein Nup98-Nup96 n=1 Tax=Musca vetustissima TaxID=27455 RepID=UPI002AB7B4DA|nr:nuclear pore complex protein Nup98-Nup96 [Musca vetustissima]
MFGGAKPTFGSTAPTTGFGGFNNTATSSPFGQSAFGKPATSAFGAAPTFGTQQTQPSMFGSTATQPQTTGLFGGASTSTAFGATTTTQPAFGSFAQPQQNTTLFGSAQPQANSTSLFGQPAATSAFGAAVKPGGLGGFGQTATQPTTSLFGQPAASTSASGFSTFGQAAPTTTSVFGSSTTSAFGQPANAAAAANPGTSIAKYVPTIGTDTLMKGGQPNNVNTKQHCITAMKEYEGKSLEELRMEDYLANRKGPQSGTTTGFGFGAAAQPTTGTGLFGSTNQPSTGLFGQPAAGTTENKGLFGSTTSAFGQQPTTGFGATATQPFGAKPFGATTTTGFGATATDNSNPFGAKPAFGQTTQPSMFGQTPATSTAPAFGQTTTGFGSAFGQNTAQQQPSLFGQQQANDPNKPAFGLGGVSTANTGFGGFGNTATSTASGGLFGAKPATGFGAAPAFGQTSTASTGFGNFSLQNTNTTGGGLFGNTTLNKPATSGFGAFGTQTSTAAPLNFNSGTGGTSLFGNTAAKPGGMFGTTLGGTQNTTGGGLFGTTGTSAFGTNNSTLGGGFGTTLGGSLSTMGGLPGTPQQQQQVPIHQQILSKVTSPYGDNPIFKDLKRNEENDPTKATNPAAQKAILESGNVSNQFKVTTKSSPSVVRVKPIGSSLTKKSLFEGLEEFDASVESFSLKPNAKRLILKPKNNQSLGGGGTQTPPVSQQNTPQRQAPGSGADVRNDSFSGEIPTEPPSRDTAVTSSGGLGTGGRGTPLSSGTPTTSINTGGGGALDSSRRESWLHPNNLEKVRQHNLNAGFEPVSSHNSTLTELVPRKPLETFSGRMSVSTVQENPFEDQPSRLEGMSSVTAAGGAGGANESIISSRSYSGEDKSILVEDNQAEYEEHPTGITLKRVGYYTIPSLDDLKSYLAEDGSCVVPNFTVGREGYGNVYFGKEMDVAGLNLDEIVHFRNKEIIIYPDDDNKPPIGQGLNREAQVTLDQVWPLDKSIHEPIKDPQRLAEMDWEAKLRRVCDKNDTRFIEYRPETGSWVFRVKHFSKYGLNDSDEEDELPTDPKKAKMGATALDAAKQQAAAGGVAGAVGQDKMTLAALKNAQKISEDAARSLDPKSLTNVGFYPMDESAEFMLMDKTQYFQNNGNDFSMFDYPQQNYKQGLTSPTTTLARDMGTDSHKLQLMKASFFIEDDNKSETSEFGLQRDYNRNMSTAGGGLFGRHIQDMYDSSQSLWKDGPGLGGHLSETSSQADFGNVLASPPAPASSAGSLISVAKSKDAHKTIATDSETAVEQVVTKMPPFLVRPKVAMIKSLAAHVPLSKSISYPLRFKWPADLGLYNGRKFKMGFGPQNTLIVPTTRNNLNREIKSKNLLEVSSLLFKTRGVNDFSNTVLQQIKLSATQSYENFKESIVDHLQIQLRNSQQQDVEGSECPYIKSDGGTDLIVKHLDEAIKLINLGPLEEYNVSVWSLCLALWGDHEALEGRDPTSHFVVMYRRNLLSEWLENTLTDKDLLTRTVSKHTYLEHLMDLIMCHKVTEACELAFSYDDANMSLLLAQLSSGPTVRQLMEDQLAAWNSDKADQFIQIERLKMYMLVAGVSLMSSSHGVINTLDGIEWIKVLALQLWYLSSPTSSITDALLAYEKSFKSEEFFCLPPTPVYMDDSGERQNIYDLRYHLLQLFSKRSHPMESLLNPATHTVDPMDYRLSWLLLQTLEALGYRHCSELSESQLHVGFASQLENNDLWEWAIFVLLHIKDRNQRELAVQNVLYRYVSVAKDVTLTDKEKFVINNLGVPEKWIDYAKAVKAGSVQNYHLQAKYLLKAKQWSLAHEIIFQHIAPDAIINDNLDYLHNLLSQFESPDLNKAVKVPNWSNQGQIFLDFIDINEKFKGLKSLKTEADIEARWENLKPQLADLCSRINLLPCPTPKHRLCQSEIAQNLACLVRGVLLVCPILNPCLIIKIALERLPLPQEFAQQELRALLDTLVGDLSKVQVVPSEV